ncbi:MAG: hypothetical protein ABIT71_20720 [Vicinamibacteraceae bacterium]
MIQPRSRARARALAAGLVAGVALWCTRGGLEVVAGADGPMRVALLPSGWQALSLIGGMVGVAFGIAHLVAWAASGSGRTITDDDADVTRPLLATGVLVLPFLPWLADTWPALTVLAGRFALLVWFVVGTLTLQAAAVRIRVARRVHGYIFPTAAASIVVASLLLYGGVAWRFAGSGLFPGGDEPHYLVLAQSLWRDHDFKIENNHTRGDTLEYYRLPLQPHYLERGRDGEIYSIHPVGLAIVAAPIYAAGGYYGVVAFLICCAAGAAAGLWLAALRLTGSGGAATLAWIGAAVSAPFVFNSITVYPEVPAAACAMAAYLIATRPGGIGRDLRRATACGLVLACLPWLSSKYGLMMAALAMLALGRLWLPLADEAEDTQLPIPNPQLPDEPRPGQASAASSLAVGRWTSGVRQRIRVSLALTLPMVVSVALWMAFFYWIWGSPFPSVVYGTQRPVRWEYFVKGGPGLLFDQEYGIVPAAPIFGAALVGLVAMLWSDARSRRIAAEIIVIFVALLVPVGAFHLWSGGSGAIGRPLIAAVLLLGLPIAWLAQRTARSTVATAALGLLAAASVAQMLFLLCAQKGLLLVAGRDGVSRLLEYWSPSWRLWTLAPSFLIQAPAIAWAFTAIWLLALAAAALAVARMRRLPPGAAGLAACSVAAAAILLVSVLVPATLDRWRTAAPPPGVRPQIALLSEFDAQRRPLGVVYDPLRRVPAAEIPPLLALVAGPRARGERTGVDLLYDARWALPAGRYQLDVDGRGRTIQGEIGLQVGRVGPPLRTWTIAPATRWSTTLDLPANARFVGFRASPDLVGAAPELRLIPRAVADLRTRRTDPDVLQSRQYGDVTVFFYDERVSPEPTGFWTRGDSSSRLAVSLAPDRPTLLRLRAGPVGATVQTIVDGDVQRVTLEPKATRDITLRSRHTVASVEMLTEGGFVPAELDPTTRDRRRLGVWVEVVR